jgi:hypothetical protein
LFEFYYLLYRGGTERERKGSWESIGIIKYGERVNRKNLTSFDSFGKFTLDLLLSTDPYLSHPKTHQK